MAERDDLEYEEAPVANPRGASHARTRSAPSGVAPSEPEQPPPPPPASTKPAARPSSLHVLAASGSRSTFMNPNSPGPSPLLSPLPPAQEPSYDQPLNRQRSILRQPAATNDIGIAAPVQRPPMQRRGRSFNGQQRTPQVQIQAQPRRAQSTSPPQRNSTIHPSVPVGGIVGPGMQMDGTEADYGAEEDIVDAELGPRRPFSIRNSAGRASRVTEDVTPRGEEFVQEEEYYEDVARPRAPVRTRVDSGARSRVSFGDNVRNNPQSFGEGDDVINLGQYPMNGGGGSPRNGGGFSTMTLQGRLSRQSGVDTIVPLIQTQEYKPVRIV